MFSRFQIFAVLAIVCLAAFVHSAENDSPLVKRQVGAAGLAGKPNPYGAYPNAYNRAPGYNPYNQYNPYAPPCNPYGPYGNPLGYNGYPGNPYDPSNPANLNNPLGVTGAPGAI